MRSAILATLVMVPAAAFAQQVPAVQTAQASAGAAAPGVSAAAQAGLAAHPPANMQGTTVGLQQNGAGQQPQVVIPPGMPPVNRPLSANPKLNDKEKVAAHVADQWIKHFDRPTRGEDGTVRWVFGASMPSVVCAPLEVCDVALAPGEVVNNIHLGDKIRWNVTPGVSGVGTDRVTHLIIKPTDAGLVTSMLVFTDQRTYSIKLIATQKQWTPMTAFTYPESAQAAWASYGATMGATTQSTTATTTNPMGGANISLEYRISGSAPWKPTNAYTMGGKTYIQFPSSVRYNSAPALVGLANDGGWFSSPSEQMMIYRVVGNQYVVDGVINHAKLIAGVGGGKQEVDIRRVVN